MSKLSVNDHLEGILSDFEALKRSFEIEDVDDIPSFSVTPISNKANEGCDGGDQSSSLAFNNSGLGSTAHYSCISLNSNSSPVIKTRTVVSSISFNRGTTDKPTIHRNGTSVTRTTSFQSRLNPNGYSLFPGPGSDNDSPHSSTSPLEYSGGGVGVPHHKNLVSYSCPPSQGEGGINLESTPDLRKCASHGSVFHSEVDKGSRSMPGAPGDGGGEIVGRGKGRMSPELQCSSTDANWIDHLQKTTFLGDKSCNGLENNFQLQGSHVMNAPQPKAKEIRLNKFPLDLDSLSPMSPTPLKPSSRVPGRLYHHSSLLPTSASSSASPTSLNSSSNNPAFSHYNPCMRFSPNFPTPCKDLPVPEMSCSPVSLYPGQSVQLGTVGIQVDQFPQASTYSLSCPRPIQSFEVSTDDTSDSVDSILQRIASYWSGTTDTTQVTLSQPSVVESKAQSALGCPAEKTCMSKKRQQEKQESASTDTLILMEERDEKDMGLMGKEREEQTANINTPKSLKKEFCAKLLEEEETNTEKETEDGQIKKEIDANIKVEVRQSAPDLKMSIIRDTDLFGYVGIEAVLDQMKLKTMKAGFEFNIMVVGQSGLGKSTLVNTLFKSKVSRKSCTPNFEEKICKTVKLHSVSHLIEEKGVKMKLTVIDTPGFGDQINNKNCWEPIMKYINEQYEKYLREELHVKRKRRIPDTRVHCCIYFLPPTGHRLRPIDIEFMRRLGKIVSIVPVIAKADTLTIEERLEFKERIREDLASYGIHVYPQKEYDEDPEEYILNERIRESIPFAVVGTDKEHMVNGNNVLGRKTKWGIVEVENVAHCEFVNLRDLLIRSHLQDLKDVTNDIHYETYRVQRLNESNMTFSELGFSTWPLENGTAEKSDSESHL